MSDAIFGAVVALVSVLLGYGLGYKDRDKDD